MVSTTAFVLSGLFVGAAFGFVLQRGRFCMNSAYREVLFGDYTLLRAYLLAVVITMIGANLVEDLGWLRHVDATGALVAGELERQTFVPWANIIGGYIFGMGIVLAGGCGSGIVYRIGEGNLAYVVAVFSFFFGISATKFGTLKPLYDVLLSVRWPKEGTAPTLYSVLGVNKWFVIAVIAAVFLVFVSQGRPFLKAKKGYSWSVAGLLVGLIAVAAWWVSEYFGGRARGLSFTGPVRELFLTVIFGNYQNDPSAVVPTESRTVLGVAFSWSALYVLAVPVGAYISAKLLHEFGLKVPPVSDLLRGLFGGFLMGVGAEIGGGCNIGHGLTGVSTLAVSSWVANAFIFLGDWTMVYFLLIRPMRKRGV
jgi:uncharacterized membrane protein YedE/YeeE